VGLDVATKGPFTLSRRKRVVPRKQIVAFLLSLLLQILVRTYQKLSFLDILLVYSRPNPFKFYIVKKITRLLQAPRYILENDLPKKGKQQLALNFLQENPAYNPKTIIRI
jgi:hypothetical protein